MERNSEKIRQEVEETKQELKNNLRHLSSHVRQSVDETKEKVDTVIQNVSDRVNLKQQTIRHPLTMVGLSLVGGVVTSRWFTRPKAVAATAFFHKVFKEFHPELKLAKGIAFQIAAKKLVDYVQETYPQWKEEASRLGESLKSHDSERSVEETS